VVPCFVTTKQGKLETKHRDRVLGCLWGGLVSEVKGK